MTTIALALVAGARNPADAHPLHTTVTEVTADASRHTLRAVMRVFADDFARAVAGTDHPASRGPVTDASAFRYLQKTFVLAGQDGRSIPLRWCGIRRTGDLLWLCVEAAAPTGMTGVRVRNDALSDLYPDQVNIVRALSGGSARSLLFTRNAAARPLL